MEAAFLADVRQKWREAFNAQVEGDYALALQLYQAVAGAQSYISATEKDGLRVEFGDPAKTILMLQGLIAKANGAGKVRRIPIVHQRPTYPGEVIETYDGGYPY